MGRNEEARKISDALQEIGPDKILDPKGNNTIDIWMRHCFNRGWFLLQDGKYREGSQLLEYGRHLRTYGNPPIRTSKPIYNPSEHDIQGKTILLALEGGAGDEVIHVRFAKSFKDLGASRVIVSTSHNLQSVVSRVDGVDDVYTTEDIVNDYDKESIQYDFWIPAFSAGWVAGHTLADLPNSPYLSVNDIFKEEWVEKIDSLNPSNKIKVGIRWAGNPKFEHQQYRKFPTEFITNLQKYQQIQLYSFQRDDNLIDLSDSSIVDLNEELISWEDTIAALDCMDLVITSCTSVAHVASALGKETWVLVPILPYHIWSFGSPLTTTTPYYKSSRIYRQQRAGEWNDTFQLLYRELESKFGLSTIDMPNADKPIINLNMGSGLRPMDGYVNVDIDPSVNPDQVLDLSITPWPWPDNTFSSINSACALERVGSSRKDLDRIISEMYRVSVDGATWTIEFPHWRSNIALADLSVVHLLNPGIFLNYDKKAVFKYVSSGPEYLQDVSTIRTPVDIEIIHTGTEYSLKGLTLLNTIQDESEASKFQAYAVEEGNGYVDRVRLQIVVHKPARIDSNHIIDKLVECQQSVNNGIMIKNA